MGATAIASEPSLSPRARLRAWAELARASNLPTCVSDVLVGYAIGVAASPDDAVSWGLLVVLVTVTALFYVGGMVLNDVVDVEIDRVERSGRPLPSGRIGVPRARAVAIACLVLAMLLALCLGPVATSVALALGGTIVLYDLLHKRYAWSVLLMGACRGLIYVMAATALGTPEPGVLGALAAALALYVALFSYVARAEAKSAPGGRRWLALAMPVAVLSPIPIVASNPLPGWVWPLVGATLAWLSFAARSALARPARTVPAILAWIAGICLVDALYLALLDRPWLVVAALACFAASVWAHRHVLGT